MFLINTRLDRSLGSEEGEAPILSLSLLVIQRSSILLLWITNNERERIGASPSSLPNDLSSRVLIKNIAHRKFRGNAYYHHSAQHQHIKTTKYVELKLISYNKQNNLKGTKKKSIPKEITN